MNRTIVRLTAFALLGLASGASITQAAEQPDATFDFSGGSIAAGIGYSWGHGVLHYQGKDYPCSISGLSIVNVGASSIKGSGNVYHLAKIGDFPGNFTAITAGATVAGGASITSMKNQNGVVMDLSETHAGLQFTLAPSGVAVAFSGPVTEMSGSSLQH